MKALIIEDEDLAARRLMGLITDVAPDFELFGPLDTISAATEHLSKNSSYDLLFLDIQLADGKSFSIFDKIKVNIPVIFTTAYDEYAIKAFELNSIDYLLKPINVEKLKASIEKFRNFKELFNGNSANNDLFELFKTIQTNKAQNFKTRFLVNKGDTLITIYTKEIAYFFAEEKNVFLVTTDKKQYLVNYTLEELDGKLNPSEFFRVNRQFIISINSILKAHNYFNYKLKLELNPTPATEVIVSKTRTSEFKAWLNGE